MFSHMLDSRLYDPATTSISRHVMLNVAYTALVPRRFYQWGAAKRFKSPYAAMKGNEN